MKCINSGSSGNGYALISDDEILLIECGVPAKEMLRAIDYQTGKVAGSLISHEHGDHAKYIKQYMKYGIKCYTSDEVQERIETIYGEKTVGMNRMHVTKIDSFQVIPFQSPHDGTECDGFLIKHEKIGCLLFITDAEYCKYDFSKMGINHAMVECNYSEDYLDMESDQVKSNRVLQSHMELQTCKRLIQMINSPSLRNVGLLHLSSQNGNSKRFREEVAELVDCDVDVWVAEKAKERELRLEPF